MCPLFHYSAITPERNAIWIEEINSSKREGNFSLLRTKNAKSRSMTQKLMIKKGEGSSHTISFASWVLSQFETGEKSAANTVGRKGEFFGRQLTLRLKLNPQDYIMPTGK